MNQDPQVNNQTNRQPENESSNAKCIALSQSIYLWPLVHLLSVQINYILFTMLIINIINGRYMHLTHMVQFEISHK